MTEIPAHTLSDGARLPAIGLGTYPLRGDEARDAVLDGLDAGYRLVDTAVNYGNEAAIGAALARTDVPRDRLRVATKLPGRHHGYEETLASFEESRRALGLERLDLYLIHWPNPSVGRYAEAWRALVRLRDDGLVASIGVSNFAREHLERVAEESGEMPAVNQIELHPFFPQEEMLAFHARHGILTEAWSPLGKAAPVREQEPVVAAARRHGVSPAQVVLRWHVQRGSLPIPKSADPARRRENLDVFSFALDDAEVAAITALGREDGRLFGGDPHTHEEM